jgi:protein-arginine kinase activator protein McsA
MTIKVVRRVNTTDSMKGQLLLCHICREKFAFVSKTPDGKPACAACYPAGSEFIREVDGPGPAPEPDGK